VVLCRRWIRLVKQRHGLGCFENLQNRTIRFESKVTNLAETAYNVGNKRRDWFHPVRLGLF